MDGKLWEEIEEVEKIYECDECGLGIYEGDIYYEFSDYKLCESCGDTHKHTAF